MKKPVEITIVGDIEDMDELEEIVSKVRELQSAHAWDLVSAKISAQVIKRRKESE